MSDLRDMTSQEVAEQLRRGITPYVTVEEFRDGDWRKVVTLEGSQQGQAISIAQSRSQGGRHHQRVVIPVASQTFIHEWRTIWPIIDMQALCEQYYALKGIKLQRPDKKPNWKKEGF